MPIRVTVNINHASFEDYLSQKSRESAERGANAFVQKAKDNVVTAGRVNTGEMRDAINARLLESSPTKTTFLASTGTFYSAWQEKGVNGPIYPVRAKALRFKPKGASGYVFARSVKGFPGAHFMENAKNSMTVNDFLP